MSRLQSSGYESARPTHVCAARGGRFASGERFVATLAEHKDSGEIVRFDFSLAAWDAGEREPCAVDGQEDSDSGGYRVFAMWRSIEGVQEKKNSLLIGPGDLFELFESMDGEMEGRPAVFRYLLALLLMRKRVLRLVDQRVGAHGRPVLGLVRRGGQRNMPKGSEPQVYEVVDPGMDEDAIAAGIEELGNVLAGDFDGQDGA